MCSRKINDVLTAGFPTVVQLNDKFIESSLRKSTAFFFQKENNAFTKYFVIREITLFIKVKLCLKANASASYCNLKKWQFIVIRSLKLIIIHEKFFADLSTFFSYLFQLEFPHKVETNRIYNIIDT